MEDKDFTEAHHNFTKREVLGVFTQANGVVVEIIRYVWSAKVQSQVGYPSCIRFRRSWMIDGYLERSESMGVPESDFKAFVEALSKVKL